MQTNIIGLNIGGKVFLTSESTLMSTPNYFSHVLQSQIPHAKDIDGNYFIDRNWRYFEPILDFLRSGEWSHPSNLDETILRRESEFYQVLLPFEVNGGSLLIC
eukprot:TRINITY_DN3750_c0_g1_i2.p1 TRINITY_DN3750_c0_g1~~TRINITY_DN3750_c0_g1_i2.p1  ORF type:complete len:103 (+),score=10.84 TRINITY_DN3750_c0_g1_i2:67-375(+)